MQVTGAARDKEALIQQQTFSVNTIPKNAKLSWQETLAVSVANRYFVMKHLQLPVIEIIRHMLENSVVVLCIHKVV